MFVFVVVVFFFFNDTATTEIYTLSLHDALPISNQVNSDGLVEELPSERNVFLNPLGKVRGNSEGKGNVG